MSVLMPDLRILLLAFLALAGYGSRVQISNVGIMRHSSAERHRLFDDRSNSQTPSEIRRFGCQHMKCPDMSMHVLGRLLLRFSPLAQQVFVKSLERFLLTLNAAAAYNPLLLGKRSPLRNPTLARLRPSDQAASLVPSLQDSMWTVQHKIERRMLEAQRSVAVMCDTGLSKEEGEQMQAEMQAKEDMQEQVHNGNNGAYEPSGQTEDLLYTDPPNIVFVSAFRDIGRSDWDSFSRKTEEYVDNFMNLQKNLRHELILYIDTETLAKIPKLGSHVKVVDINDVSAFSDKYIDIETEIMNSPEFKETIPNHRKNNPEHKHPIYNLVNHDKLSFLRHTSELFPEYDHLVWVDFGAIRAKKSRIKLLNASQMIKNKIVYQAPEPITRQVDPREQVKSGTIFMYGSMFLVPRTMLEWFHDIYEYKLQEFHGKHVVDDDQNVVYQVYCDHPDKFSLKLDDEWFMLLRRHFHNVTELTSAEQLLYTASNEYAGDRMEHARFLLKQMESGALKRSMASFNAAITTCQKSGWWEAALAILHEMRGRGYWPDAMTFRAAILACEQGGQWETAIQLLEDMSDDDLEPDPQTLNAAMTCCEMSGQVSRGLSVLARR